MVRLAEAAPNIQAIKESSGKLPQIAELVHILPRGFKIFSGDDNLALASIGVGAHGLISVAANEIPAEMGRMIRAALQQQLGRGARAGAPLRAADRRQLLGLESRPGEDGAEPDGPRAATTSACRWFRPRPPPAPSWSGWPANWACSSTRPKAIWACSSRVFPACLACKLRVCHARFRSEACG